MKVVLVLFDTLVRRSLGVYGGSVKTPNFDRLQELSVVFDSHYSGSLPCMPARRDLHTGRMHFLHSSWGSLEPFDNSLPKVLRDTKGIHSHIITDHCHYFSYGGWGYCKAFSNWEYIRGQEGDQEKSLLKFDPTNFANKYSGDQYPTENKYTQRPMSKIQHMINREFYQNKEEDFSLVKCFKSAYQFIDENHDVDNWFLQLECFDPHEPFYAPERFRSECGISEDDLIEDWISYGRMENNTATAQKIGKNYKALLKMCDEYLGTLLTRFDQYNLWDDTMLIVTTDHGLLFGEHDLWGKNREAYYEEISHIPLFIHHPKYKQKSGERRSYVTQTPDIMPTILDFFDIPIPEEVTGKSILPVLKEDSQQERTIIFGMFGGPIGATNGKYVYYHYPTDLSSENNLYEYTLMPEHIHNPFSIEELQTMTLSDPFKFTKGIRLLKIKALDTAKRIPLDREGVGSGFVETESRLYDLINDPFQNNPLNNNNIVTYFKEKIVDIMKELEAPSESFKRFNL